MANALEALRILAGGPSSRRVVPQEEYKFAGAVPTQGELSSPYERESAARAARADEADRARTAETEALNQEMLGFNRPDVTARREAEFGQKMRLAGEPARVAGEANVRAARTASEGRANALEQLLGMGAGGRVSVSGVGSIGPNPADLQTQKDIAASGRVGQAGANASALAQIKELLKKRSTGFFGMGGNAADTDAQIAALSGGGGTVAMLSPDGRPLNVPASEVARLETLGAKRQ